MYIGEKEEEEDLTPLSVSLSLSWRLPYSQFRISYGISTFVFGAMLCCASNENDGRAYTYTKVSVVFCYV